ncbi:enolase C-terminal domain-like protein [Streptomyces goshikiensis]|uniref:enolase C-terminal domain-like protein n=1 Tax=Streptomyces goshikiensis TaxID=1942 RepID=UPI00365B381E
MLGRAVTHRGDAAAAGLKHLIPEIRAEGWAFTKRGLRGHPGASGGALADVLRAAAATAEPVAVDAVGTWPPPLAAEFAAAADPAAPVWLEEPAPTHDPRVHQRLRTLPACGGGAPHPGRRRACRSRRDPADRPHPRHRGLRRAHRGRRILARTTRPRSHTPRRFFYEPRVPQATAA